MVLHPDMSRGCSLRIAQVATVYIWSLHVVPVYAHSGGIAEGKTRIYNRSCNAPPDLPTQSMENFSPR